MRQRIEHRGQKTTLYALMFIGGVYEKNF